MKLFPAFFQSPSQIALRSDKPERLQDQSLPKITPPFFCFRLPPLSPFLSPRLPVWPEQYKGKEQKAVKKKGSREIGRETFEDAGKKHNASPYALTPDRTLANRGEVVVVAKEEQSRREKNTFSKQIRFLPC